jgi:2-polyprenyl-3-methyl-5-hydroxy-6-metoxy-1,4-benzoquinol methylase
MDRLLGFGEILIISRKPGNRGSIPRGPALDKRGRMNAKGKYVKVNEMYSRWAGEYDKPNLLLFLEEQKTRKLFSFKGKDILDLGCGTGRYAVPLARNNRVVAVDFNRNMLGVARKKAEEAKVRIDFIKAEVTKYRPTRKFDVILSMLVHDHVKDLAKAAKVIFLASKKGTEVFISNVNPKFTYGSKFLGKRKMFGEYCTDEYYHPLGEYLEVFRRGGFELVGSWDLIFEKKYQKLVEVDYPEINGEFLGVLYQFRRVR